MKTAKWIVVFFSIVLAGQLSYGAEGKQSKEKKRFSNETHFSLVNTTGNSDTLTVAGKNAMQYKFTDRWTGSWLAGGLYAENDGDKSAERYFTDLRADYSITKQWYAYGLGTWLRDEFAGFDHRISVGPGTGYKFLTGPQHFLLGETGLNYTVENYSDKGESTERFIEGRLFGKYEWALTERIKFSQSLEYLQSFKKASLWKLNSETALVTTLTDILALKVSYGVYYNNDPRPDDLDDTDTILATSLVITY